jgi:uncharacterized membrane protein (UPF0127 family)
MRLPRPLLVIVVVVVCTWENAHGQYAVPLAEVRFPDKTRVKVEVADTEPQRQRGLMFRTSLAENEGMIFVFDVPGDHPFWMQNCLIALDMLWLDARGRVLSIAASVPPCRFSACPPPCPSSECPTYSPVPGTQAIYVVELMSGFAQKHRLKVGDTLTLTGVPKRPAASR